MINARLTQEEWEEIQRMRGINHKRVKTKEAAERLGTTVIDVMYRVRAGEFGSAVKKGRRYEYFIYEDDLKKYMDRL